MSKIISGRLGPQYYFRVIFKGDGWIMSYHEGPETDLIRLQFIIPCRG